VEIIAPSSQKYTDQNRTPAITIGPRKNSQKNSGQDSCSWENDPALSCAMANLSVRIKSWSRNNRRIVTAAGIVAVATVGAIINSLLGVPLKSLLDAARFLAIGWITAPSLLLLGMSAFSLVGLFAIWKQFLRPHQKPDTFGNAKWKCIWKGTRIVSAMQPFCDVPGCGQALSINQSQDEKGHDLTTLACPATNCFNKKFNVSRHELLRRAKETLEKRAIIQHEGQDWLNVPENYSR
jgi:hypothetical protein